MQESKEIGSYITTKEELDALYKSIQKTTTKKEKTDETEATNNQEK